jgi:hypothetical protein
VPTALALFLAFMLITLAGTALAAISDRIEGRRP